MQNINDFTQKQKKETLKIVPLSTISAGPSCSKLMKSLVRKMLNWLVKKMLNFKCNISKTAAFFLQKKCETLLHFFCQKITGID